MTEFTNYALGTARPLSSAQYTNGVSGGISQWDVTLIFQYNAANESNEPVAQPVARLVMSPQHAKALVAVVQQAVDQWEGQFGPLPSLETLLPQVKLPESGAEDHAGD